MGVTLTSAGEALKARLQAEGKPLIIDTFIFAYIEGQDHTQLPPPGQDVPTENVVHQTHIPEEYRAFVTPSQVVYSALLGSDVGDFAFNWQGLYCAEHDTLVAVATFPTLQKRKYNQATNTPGNNVTRNFLLAFTGAQELTQIVVEAKVWQLDFTVRLKGIDERERLSNFDIYGRASFLESGWELAYTGGMYSFTPGVGYVAGIRAALLQPLPVQPVQYSCDVWLDVSMEPDGSDVITVVTPVFTAPDAPLADYISPAPFNVQHYCEKVAHIPSEGAAPQNIRPESPWGGGVPETRKINTAVPLTGGGELTGDLTLKINATSAPTANNVILRDAAGRAQVAAPVAAADIARKADVDAVATATGTTYVKKAGDTMTGLLKFNLGQGVKTPIDIRPGPLPAYGDALLLSAGGLTIIGGGEMPTNWVAQNPEVNLDAENCIVGADSTVLFVSNYQNVDQAKTMYFDDAGNLRPSINGTLSLGGTNFRWNTAFINTITTTRVVGPADKLTTARTIALTGAATGTATAFDGTKNISIPVTGLDISKATMGVLPVAHGGTGMTTFAPFPMPKTAAGVGQVVMVVGRLKPLPAGGTWFWFGFSATYEGNGGSNINVGSVAARGITAGGTTINADVAHTVAWRIA